MRTRDLCDAVYIHDDIAIAVEYGYGRKDNGDSAQGHVVLFVNMGYKFTSLTVVKYLKVVVRLAFERRRIDGKLWRANRSSSEDQTLTGCSWSGFARR